MLSQNSAWPRRRGFTLVELLVVIAIIGVLIALLLPAVQAAREAARRSQCLNNLKQMGLAVHNYHDVNRQLPPSRIAYRYLGWSAFILPYLEQQNLYDSINLKVRYPDQATAVQQTSIQAFVCPSRHSVGQQTTAVNTDVTVDQGAVWDYASCDGDFTSGAYRSNASTGMLIVANTSTANPSQGKWPSQTKIASVTDGTSNTILIGEKHIHIEDLGTENSSTLADGPILSGWAYTSMRLAGPGRPLATNMRHTTVKNEIFGSWHPTVTNFVMGDGSVRSLSVTIDTTNLGRLANRSDGQTVTGL